MMVTCIACGMPMEETSDYPNGDTSKNYCVHCSKSDGSMQTFEEKKSALTKFIVKTQGFDETAAAKIAENSMKKLPAWEEYFK